MFRIKFWITNQFQWHHNVIHDSGTCRLIISDIWQINMIWTDEWTKTWLLFGRYHCVNVRHKSVVLRIFLIDVVLIVRFFLIPLLKNSLYRSVNSNSHRRCHALSIFITQDVMFHFQNCLVKLKLYFTWVIKRDIARFRTWLKQRVFNISYQCYLKMDWEYSRTKSYKAIYRSYSLVGGRYSAASGELTGAWIARCPVHHMFVGKRRGS